MKKIFFEHQPLTKTDIKALWKNALFVFDTNLLLNLYRYSQETSDKFINILSELDNRIWLPYKVGQEFYKNRLQVISDQIKNYKDFEIELKTLVEKIETKKGTPFFSADLSKKVVDLYSELEEEMSKHVNNYEKFFKNDPILSQVNSIFDGKVGEDLSEEKLSELKKRGAQRYKDKTPPGYCDQKKPDPDKFGDLILWEQILNKATKDSNDVILIIDDNKEDWWLLHHGKTISPRPELIKEFRKITSRRIHFYKPFQFLEFSNEFLNKNVQKETIDEVKNYTNFASRSDTYLHIRIVLEGSLLSFNKLYSELLKNGYQLFAETDETKTNHQLNILLPNIPDLERRLHSRYFSNLADLGLCLTKIEKLSPESNTD